MTIPKFSPNPASTGIMSERTRKVLRKIRLESSERKNGSETFSETKKPKRVKATNTDAMYLDVCDLVERKFNRKN